VAGFQPHAFSEAPSLSAEPGPCGGRKPLPWTLVRLELVGLLRHDTPVAYASENLPRMDELDEVPTRPLDPFERASLDALRADRDVVIEQHGGHILMLGSLRAGKDCLECHSVPRGTLLGALSYKLVPRAAAPPPAEPLPQELQAAHESSLPSLAGGP
jgi:hypothetical protein